MDMGRLARIMEDGFSFSKEYDFAPEDEQDALDNYQRILTALGEIAGEVVAPTAEETDRVGNILNDNGNVTYAPGIAEAIKDRKSVV